MADLSTIARPYASAVFELAKKDNALAKWSDMLTSLATVAVDDTMRGFIASPKSTPEQVSELVIEVAGSALDSNAKNLVKLLAENGRLAALPDVAARFEMLKTEAEGSVDVEVTSVEPLSEDHKQRLGESLRKKLGREVRMSFSQDPSLLGGALIKAGDLIIDGTVRGRLDKLSGALTG